MILLLLQLLAKTKKWYNKAAYSSGIRVKVPASLLEKKFRYTHGIKGETLAGESSARGYFVLKQYYANFGTSSSYEEDTINVLLISQCKYCTIVKMLLLIYFAVKAIQIG